MPATRKRNVATGRTGLTGRGALNMVRNGITYYNCGIIEAARENGVAIRIVQGGKECLAAPRMVHRPSLSGTYGEQHEESGEGKYIAQNAISTDGDKTIVTGAQNVNPYMVNERCYHSIVAAFHRSAGRQLNEMTAVIKNSRADGEHLEWQGKTNEADAVAVTPWLTRNDIWDKAREINDELFGILRKSKSHRDDVEEHLGTKAKFFQNIDVLRRSRRTFHIATGETEYGGGATPYHMPLEQCGFAIDCFFLTTDFDSNGNEIGEYFYRMAYGRNTPWVLYKREWVGLDTNASFAYLNDSVLQKAKDRQKKAA